MQIQWIVPIIVVFFYVLSAVLKAKQEAEAKMPRRPEQGRAGSELDRFLEEIERLKRQHSAPPQEPGENYGEEPPTVVRQKKPVLVRIAPPVQRSRPKRQTAQKNAVVEAAETPIVAALSNRIVATPVSEPRIQTLPVMSMLRDPKKLIDAVVLFEVLGPPRSKRRGPA